MEIDKKLLRLENLEDNFSAVYLYKLKGDFYRYFCEFSILEIWDNNIKESQ